MKETASRDSQRLVDEAIKYQIMQSDDWETRNEQLEGSTAALEYKNTATGTWDKVYFVREDGSWKIALDESMKAILKAKQ